VHGATFSTLRDALARQGGHLLVQVLRDMIAGMAKSVPQDQLGYTSPWPYAHLVTQDDYRVRWLEQSAQQLVWTHNAIGHEVRQMVKQIFDYH
jgi:methionyl-tRNA formyltransferase